MGFREAKDLLIFIVVILFITNIFANNLGDSMTAVSDESLSGDGVGYLGGIYNDDTGKLHNNGTVIVDWVSNEDDIAPNSAFDYLLISWNFIKSAIKLPLNFLYAPYTLTKAFISLDGDRVDFLYWLPNLIGIIWSIILGLTIVQIVWKE